VIVSQGCGSGPSHCPRLFLLTLFQVPEALEVAVEVGVDATTSIGDPDSEVPEWTALLVLIFEFPLLLEGAKRSSSMSFVSSLECLHPEVDLSKLRSNVAAGPTCLNLRGW